MKLLIMLLTGLICSCSSPDDFSSIASLKVKKLAGGFRFTEGPALSPTSDIYFTDIPNKTILRWSQGKISTFRKNSGGANGLYFDADGRLICCQGLEGRVVAIDQDGHETILAARFNKKRFNKPNDLWIDPKGGIYFTDPNYGKSTLSQPGEHVYYIKPGGGVIRVADDFLRPNGIIGTKDGKTLYITDHKGDKTFTYTIDHDGRLSGKKLFAAVGGDGMTLDARGNLYLARAGIEIFSPHGQKLAEIQIPERPTNCTFGGPRGKTLFITARQGFYSIELP